MKKCVRFLGFRSLVWVVLASVVLGISLPVSAGEFDLPSFLRPPDSFSMGEGEDFEGDRDSYASPLFYMPDIYEAHRLTGYSAVALTILAMLSGDDSTFHKVSGASAAVFGVAAGATGHMAYGEGIDFREGWTRENIHAGSGYLATAALVLTGALGAADKKHSAAGGIATAAVVVPVAVFVF